MLMMIADIEITELEKINLNLINIARIVTKNLLRRILSYSNWKKLTKNKTKSDFIKLIKNKLGVKNRKSHVWDGIIESVSKVTLDDLLKQTNKL